MNVSHLNAPEPPWLVGVNSSCTAAVESRLRASIAERNSPFFETLDGSICASLNDFYGAISAALKFPAYFGNNLHALQDCLADLSWIEPPPDAVLILVQKADSFLCNESEGRVDAVLTHMMLAAEEWSQPVKLGEWWDRDAVPFHTVFCFETNIRRSALNLPSMDL